METISLPKTTSKRKIEYCRSKWKVHDFEVWSGELICKVAVLCMDGSLLVWVGGDKAALSEMALGMPQEHGSLATTLLGEESSAAGLARRLATKLQCPVYVCCGQTFDRFTAPLVEKGIAIEFKEHPECFR
ncbi:uncharacterized protein LOC119831484 [Zerene cesonia]|uniref:uncharacterized protein LOC119831484 n=1 Tax=Zerene cesonia TaxID=33412 RepID=UPI0018E4EE5D|nr:uncharacterized protein LOC119831484 [Zerene cesonia]